MNTVFLLLHSYQYGKESEHESTKLIGIYSSYLIAEKAIEKYKDLPGFNNYPAECFCLEGYVLDEEYWTEGFVDVNED